VIRALWVAATSPYVAWTASRYPRQTPAGTAARVRRVLRSAEPPLGLQKRVDVGAGHGGAETFWRR
jgi:hypothetical protein